MKTEQELREWVINIGENKVAEMFDEEVCGGNWIDDDWEENAETEFDWYIEYGNGEAESAVIDTIIKDAQSFLGENDDKWVSSNKYGDIDEIIREEYFLLDY